MTTMSTISRFHSGRFLLLRSRLLNRGRFLCFLLRHGAWGDAHRSGTRSSAKVASNHDHILRKDYRAVADATRDIVEVGPNGR